MLFNFLWPFVNKKSLLVIMDIVRPTPRELQVLDNAVNEFHALNIQYNNMVNGFHAHNMIFVPLPPTLTPSLNTHEIELAIRLCEQHNMVAILAREFRFYKIYLYRGPVDYYAVTVYEDRNRPPVVNQV